MKGKEMKANERKGKERKGKMLLPAALTLNKNPMLNISKEKFK